MPELPEVETTVAGLRGPLEGQRLVRVEPRRADMRKPFPAELRQRMTGARVTSLGRRAKYGLIHTDRGDTMIFHLGMSGRWVIDGDAVNIHDHLILETEEEVGGSGHHFALRDPRRFGFVDLMPTADLHLYPAFAAMGPEPLGPDFTAAYLAGMLEGRAAPIKAMLLDQRIVAGLGNIYVCEALNMAGIAPTRAAGRISRPRLAKLVEAIREVLAAAILAGGSSLRDYVRPDGQLGYFAKDWRVYGREGEACACGTTVLRRVDSGRSTFYCPACQK
ncbi:bifunctional DNA-formamidopyrimidine glycosylase/DNA-(apurinic or apyrimidinic site) lyase [Sphingobium sufflavum]|uniref:bifunctional DNA-formamidopyrimidine glycosylase/DNA-(apurinic or apyrimidinic site) lyase n=1 Tax=Sphingobium sufflavum TaxID=1129547 RepID=UPI001F33C2CF|nr:bifunctional DNA-formamidopyrimidine glycosylase/DNA-(apurinic or apyrimidinic site) lyase [Sphingobium sufflavum]MCE7795745.1 bifunctional DNA-formamidopyrimidine glycosylase/DNA-(apurinic or apyrimidinic site) lyase [Sphingobium sufflavum]